MKNYYSNRKYLQDFHSSRVERPGHEFMIIGILLVVGSVLGMIM